MNSTGVFWRMCESNEVPRKKGRILKDSTLRSRFSGFLHKSCSNKTYWWENEKQINVKRVSSQVLCKSEIYKYSTCLIKQWDQSRAESVGKNVSRILNLPQHRAVVRLCRYWKLKALSQAQAAKICSDQHVTYYHTRQLLRAHLSHHQWEQHNTKGPPVSCVAVRACTQNFRCFAEKQEKNVLM